MNENTTQQRFDQLAQTESTAVAMVKGNPVVLAAGGSAALIAGLLMPWMESFWMSMSGFAAPSGKPVLVLGILAAFFAHRLTMGRRGGGWLIVIGVLAGLYTGGYIVAIAEDESGMLYAGNGLWLSSTGAAMLVIAGLQAQARRLQKVPA